jgi:hypothetical protein
MDLVLINNRPPTGEQLAEMAEKGIAPTEYDSRETLELGVKAILRDVVNTAKFIRHDPRKTALAIMGILEDLQHGRL